MRILALSLFLLAPPLAVAQEQPAPAASAASANADPWLEYAPSDAGPGNGKHVVLLAADQEYRSEEAMPMLAKVLSKHHGFRCTVLFSVNEDGLVDPTLSTRPQDKERVHVIPGLDKLAEADLLILFHRFITLSDEDAQHVIDYLDSGKPLIGIRTANHGFIGPFRYEKGGKRVRFGDDVLGGAFRGHHGGWHREATRGHVIEAMEDHPIVAGIDDLWGPSDVYRCYPKDGELPAGCTALVMGQPLTGRTPNDPPNENKIPLPIAWTNAWTGNAGKASRVFHVTMGSARDYQCEDMRRLTVNAVYWGLGLEDRIDAESCMDIVGDYEPRASGFNYEKLDVKPRAVSEFR